MRNQRKSRRSKWGRVHDALDAISGFAYAMGVNNSYTKDYDVSDMLSQRPTKVSLSKHTGFTMKNRNK